MSTFVITITSMLNEVDHLLSLHCRQCFVVFKLITITFPVTFDYLPTKSSMNTSVHATLVHVYKSNNRQSLSKL